MMLIIAFAFILLCRGNLVCIFIDHSASHRFYIEIVRMAVSLMGYFLSPLLSDPLRVLENRLGYGRLMSNVAGTKIRQLP